MELLPALPGAWETGKVSVLKARGGFQVDMEWDEGVLTHLNVLSELGNPLELRYGEKELTFETSAGEALTPEELLPLL